MSLTNKQRRFIDEYLQSFNATQSAIKAGYSENTAYSIGWENLRKPEISEVIERRLQESAMSADEVLMRLAEQARGDIGDYALINNNRDLAEHDLSRIVKKFKRRIWYDQNGERQEEIELELYDAHAALVDIGRKWAIFTDKTSVNVNDGKPIEFKHVIVNIPDVTMEDSE